MSTLLVIAPTPPQYCALGARVWEPRMECQDKKTMAASDCFITDPFIDLVALN